MVKKRSANGHEGKCGNFVVDQFIYTSPNLIVKLGIFVLRLYNLQHTFCVFSHLVFFMWLCILMIAEEKWRHIQHFIIYNLYH